MNTKPIAIVFMSETGQSAELAEKLAEAGVDSIIPKGSDEFYRMLNTQRVDVVVVENKLQGFLTGLEILERLYSDLLRPATVLIATSSSELQARARESGVDCIIKPGSGIPVLVDAVRSQLATTKLSQVVISLEARKLVQKHAHAIRPLPQLLIKISSYLDHENVPITELAQDISVDQRITAELLKITNSTAFALRRRVTTAFDAVNFLGVRRTISLVLSAGVISAQAGTLRDWPADMRNWYQRRSVLTACTAATFAKRLEDVSADTAYVLGLLQDIGILVLAQAHGQRYSQLITRVTEIGQLRLELTEKQEFDFTHAEVSAALLQMWGLPHSLVSMISYHHRPEIIASLSSTEQRFLHVMQIGEAAANLTDVSSAQRYQSLHQLLAVYGASQSHQCKICLAEAVSTTMESSRLLSIPVPDQATLNRLIENLASGDSESPDASAESEANAEQPAAPRTHEAHDAVVEPACIASEPEQNGLKSSAEEFLLVIEDDPKVSLLVTRYLKPLGVVVLACETLESAKLVANGALAILCDVHLRHESGIDLVRALRKEGFNGPVIMISGDRTRATIAECVAAGISDFLTKPFGRAQLLEKL